MGKCIDINKHKQEHTCDNCRYNEHGIRCKNPDYAKFIEETLRTGYCSGFEARDFSRVRFTEN